MAQRPAMTLVLHARMRAVRRRDGDRVQLGVGGGGGVDGACVGEERGGACRARRTGVTFVFSVA